MALIVLYLLSAILVFIKIEPFTFAGGLLNICYLPGLCIFAIGRRNKIVFEDLILAFPYSIGVSSILILGLLFFGIHINNIPVIIFAINGIGTLVCIIAGIKHAVYPAMAVNRQELRFSLFALSLTLLLSIPFLLGPNRIGISGHAFHHSVMVTQVLNGIFPPENPGLGGTIIGYYWGFHALITALAVKSNFHQIQIMFILNVISLYFIICLSYLFAKAFNLSEVYCYILPLAVIGIMRSDAGIVYLVKLFSGKLMPLNQLTASPKEPSDVLFYWISGLPWIDSRLFSLHKLYNVSGMMLALSLCYGYLLILLKRGVCMNKIDITGIALIISACFFNYPPLAIFPLLHVPIWSLYLFLSAHGNIKEKIVQVSRIAFPYIVAGLIVSPYMLYVVAGRAVSSGSQGGIFNFDFYNQSLKNMVVFMLPFPAIAYGAWVAMKRFALSKEFFFLFIGTSLCLILTVFTRWPFDNSYKYNYILAIFFSLFFVFALADLLTFLASQWLKRLIVAIIILFLSLTPIIVESSHIVSSYSTDYIYSFSGRHFIYAQDSKKNEAYIWIRDNTPGNTLLMLSYVETNWPCCGFNNNYEPAAIAERNLYVIKDTDYTVTNPDYAKRLEFREKLFATPNDPQVIDFFKSLNRPVYLLIEENMDVNRFFVEKRFKAFPSDLGKEFVPVFKNENQRVYRLSLDK